jgi:hypothetical protein
MVRPSVASTVLCISFILALTKAAAPKTMLDLQQMTGDYVEHRVDEEEAKLVARTMYPELSECLSYFVLGKVVCYCCTIDTESEKYER